MTPPPFDHAAPLRFAAIGAGFWARFQLAAWQEVEGAVCVALCDRERARAERLAEALAIPAVYDDAAEMLRRERPDFAEVITSPDTHGELVHLAAAHRVPCVCQKPLAPALAEAREVAEACARAGVPLIVHENWRFQRPVRELKRILDSGRVGRPFRARIEAIWSFPVFRNQPGLRQLERLILADLGVHLLDVARFLFGEAESVYCETQRVHADIRGEDAATVVMAMGLPATRRVTVVSSMAYAETPLEVEYFPATLIFVEAERGSIELAPDYWLKTTAEKGVESRRMAPVIYPWADPAYALVHASIVDAHREILRALRAGTPAETHADDNLRTLELVEAAYRSAAEGRVVRIGGETPSAPTTGP